MLVQRAGSSESPAQNDSAEWFSEPQGERLIQ